MPWKGSPSPTARILRHAFAAVAGFLAVAFVFSVPSVLAQTASGPFDAGNVQTIATQAGVDGGADIFQIIGNILNIVFGFLGVLLLCYILYAGYLWMTAGGATEQIDKAKSYLKNAVIGLVIMVSAFAISRFILDWLGGDGGGAGGSGSAISTGIRPGSGFPGSAGALGAGLIDYHIPERDAREVPRNASIIIAFKQPVDPASVILGYTEATSSTARDLNTDAVHVFPTGQELTGSLRSNQVEAYLAQGNQILVLRPKEYLGNPTRNTDYTVRLLPGDRGLRLYSEGASGPSIFAGSGGRLTSDDGYSWRFEVSTAVDDTPPRLTSVVPVAAGRYAPNVVVQMNFDKALNPITASGLVRAGSGFQNVEVAASPLTGTGASRPDGTFTLSNHFRTIEFVTNVSCGVNSCGREVYCLPFSSNISVHIRAATLGEVPPQARIIRGGGAALYDGIVDYTGNSFDGDSDGIAEGPDADGVARDDYRWAFRTDAVPNLAAPLITAVDPSARASNVPVDAQVNASFDTFLQASTLTTDTVLLRTNEPEELRDTFWWTVGMSELRADGSVASAGDAAVRARGQIEHRPFSSATRTEAGILAPQYAPFFTAGVQNIYQNCFNPGSSARCTGTPYCCDGVGSRTACAFPPRLEPTPLP